MVTINLKCFWTSVRPRQTSTSTRAEVCQNHNHGEWAGRNCTYNCSENFLYTYTVFILSRKGGIRVATMCWTCVYGVTETIDLYRILAGKPLEYGKSDWLLTVLCYSYEQVTCKGSWRRIFSLTLWRLKLTWILQVFKRSARTAQ